MEPKSVVEMFKEMDFGMVVFYRLFPDGSLTSQTVDIKDGKVLGQVDVHRPWKGTPKSFVAYHQKYNFQLAFTSLEGVKS